MKKYTLDFGTSKVTVKIVNGNGTLNSNLDKTKKSPSAIDAIESLIIAHAMEGINVGGEKYVAGVREVLDNLEKDDES